MPSDIRDLGVTQAALGPGRLRTPADNLKR
jgi:hypothetical protein